MQIQCSIDDKPQLETYIYIDDTMMILFNVWKPRHETASS